MKANEEVVTCRCGDDPQEVKYRIAGYLSFALDMCSGGIPLKISEGRFEECERVAYGIADALIDIVPGNDVGSKVIRKMILELMMELQTRMMSGKYGLKHPLN